jgi:hypothetical protein
MNGFVGLFLEGIVRTFYLSKDSFNLTNIFIGLFQFPCGFQALDLILGYPGCLFKYEPAFLGFVGENLIDLSLLHDGVSGLPYTGVVKKLFEIPQSYRGAVNVVFAVAVSVKASFYLHLGTSNSSSPLSLVKVKATSATLRAFRFSVPLKMTSSIFSARRALLPCSPRTHLTASTTFDLPHPLGPRRAATPSLKSIRLRSANDLKPNISIFLRNTATPSGEESYLSL